jgi:alpha,alpha-trehalase
MPLLTSPAAATSAFDALPPDPSTGLPSLPALRAYVAAHFGPAGSDYEPAAPPDHAPVPPPSFLPRVPEGPIREGAARVHALWPALCRKATEASAPPSTDPSSFFTRTRTSTLLATPGFSIVPGDRFRESYYWDAHWTVRGLLASGCGQTAAAVVSTLVHLAKASPFSSVPNGARFYYLNRSQPPLLSPTAVLLLESGDPAVRAVALDALPTLRAERAAWDAPHRSAVVRDGRGRDHVLTRYCARWGRPRPEAYREDVAAAVAAGALAGPCPDAAAVEAAAESPTSPAADLWRGLATAAESGWDFSDRWCAGGLPEGVSATLSPRCCAAHRLLPVDLNAFLARADDALAVLCAEAGDAMAAAAHAAPAHARRAAIDGVLWDGAAGRWCDAVLPPPPSSSSSPVITLAPGVYASCWVPLWAGCGRGRGGDDPLWPAAVASLAASGLVGPGGLATSPGPGSGEQWDGPNAWPPLQALVADGLAGVSGLGGGGGGGEEAGAARTACGLAEAIVRGFVSNALAGLAAEGAVREKYCAARSDGAPGAGGEYATQVGFGWTNGVILALLRRFGWPPTAAAARESGEGGD